MRRITAFISFAAIAALGAWWVVGQRELAELRDSNAALTLQLAASAAAANPMPAPESPASEGLTQDEQTELLRLRGQIQPLRRQVTEISNRVASANSK